MRLIKLFVFLMLILFTGLDVVLADNKTTAGIIGSESDKYGIITVVGEKDIGSVINTSKSGNYLVHFLVSEKNIIDQLPVSRCSSLVWIVVCTSAENQY